MLMFFLLLIWKRSLCIYVESFFFFFQKKRSDRKSLFSMDALKQLYQPVEKSHMEQEKHLNVQKKKKKSFNWMHSLCLLFFAIYKWALSFFFVIFFLFGKNLRQVFQRRLYLSSSTCIYRKLRKMNKKKNILQFLKSILLTWVIIS